MKKGVNVKNLSREEWLEERRKGIGGSDAAAVCGLSPWKTAAGVYLDKVGEAPAFDGEASERMRIGHDLEDYVARRFAEETGKKMRRNNYMLHHDDYPFILGDIDREIVGEDAILECKTTNSYAAKDWQDEPPLHYQIQCQHYLLVTGAKRCYIAALIGNERFAWFVIERDEETIQDLLTVEADFWRRYVEAGECPPPDGSKAYEELMQARYPQDDGGEMELSNDAREAALNYLVLKDQIDEMEQRLRNARQIVEVEMRTNSKAAADGVRVTWKTQSRTSVDTKRLREEQPDIYDAYTKTSESRVFRVKQI